MTYKLSTSLRAFLLLTTAVTLVACDDKDDSQTQAQSHQEQLEQKISQLTSGVADSYPEQTISGAFLAGQFAQTHSDWNNAATYFDSVNELDPNAPFIENRIMALSMGSGHYDRALQIAKKLVQDKSGPDRSLAIMIVGLEAFKNKKYDETLNILAEAPNDGLGAAVIPLFRAWAEAGNGKTVVAPLLGKSSMSYQAIMVAGYNKDKKTIADIAKQIDFTKSEVPIRNLEDIAAIFALNGENEQSQQIYAALKIAVPERADIYTARLKDLEAGNMAAFAYPDSTPQQELSNALVGVAQILANNYQDSARIFAHMGNYLTPDDSTTLELLAQIAADQKQYDEAITYLSRINTKDDTDKRVQVQRQIALLLQQSDKDDEAIRILQDLVDNSKSVEAQIQIGDIYRGQEDYKNALAAYNNAGDLLDNKIPQKYWDLLFARGMVNERLKNWDQAEKDLQAALSYEPDQPYVLNYLGYSWTDQGKNLDKAAEMIEKAVRLKPNDGAIVDSLGWVYFRMGSYDRAVRTLEQAIELDPTEAEINDHLGDAYWRVDRRAEARFQWKRAISFSTEKDVTDRISQKLENGLPDVSSHAPAAKLVENK